MVEVNDVSKSFLLYVNRVFSIKEFLLLRGNKATQKEVLRAIDLKIDAGETVALIGTNGSGKSTLLKLITKIIYPDTGRIHTHGKLTSLLELGAGFHLDFTGRENIYFNASIFGLTRRQIDERIERIIAFSELEESIDNPVRTYSSGMYMRLAFSIAINVDAEILLIDEILAVGDQHFQDKCIQKIKELITKKVTIIMVTHDMSIVKDICTRAVWLYEGKIALDGDPEYVVSQYLERCQ